MLTLSPARLEALAQLCVQEFHQFECAQLIITFDAQDQIIGTQRLSQTLTELSGEQLANNIGGPQTNSALVASLSPWPLIYNEQSLLQLHEVDELLSQCQTQGIELLDYLCIQGLNYSSLRTETDLWYAICA